MKKTNLCEMGKAWKFLKSLLHYHYLKGVFTYTSILTLRILAARHNLLGTEDRFLSVVCKDTYPCFQHAHGGKCITAAT